MRLVSARAQTRTCNLYISCARLLGTTAALATGVHRSCCSDCKRKRRVLHSHENSHYRYHVYDHPHLHSFPTPTITRISHDHLPRSPPTITSHDHLPRSPPTI